MLSDGHGGAVGALTNPRDARTDDEEAVRFLVEASG